MKKTTIPSLIRWTGSKRPIAHKIYSYFPAHYDTYYEPFLGGGGLLYLANKNGAICSDIYAPLIELWKTVQTNPDTFIKEYTLRWNKLKTDGHSYYYEVRKHFNSTHNVHDFHFLLRTCINGAVRFNSKGEFNSSIHLTRAGMIPDTLAKNTYRWHERIKNVRFLVQDYTGVLKTITPSDFLYLDPPYAGSKNRYISNLELDTFYNFLEALNSKGIRFALSFDGTRNETDYTTPLPKDLYERKILIEYGTSPLLNVLTKKKEKTVETLYMNYSC